MFLKKTQKNEIFKCNLDLFHHLSENKNLAIKPNKNKT